MKTVTATSEYYLRKCSICGKEEFLARAGKLWGGYSVEAEAKRDFERREFAKELLQPKDRKGNVNELFDHAYGNPYKKSKIGSAVEKYRIKEDKKK